MSLTDQLSQWRYIADRLAKATGPDRELDALIAVASFVKKHDEWGEYAKVPHKNYDAGDVCVGNYWLVSRSGKSLRTSDRYTANTDAALGLVGRVLPGAEYNLLSIHDLYSAELPINGLPESGTHAGSLPLAILTALARAEIARLEAEQ